MLYIQQSVFHSVSELKNSQFTVTARQALAAKPVWALIMYIFDVHLSLAQIFIFWLMRKPQVHISCEIQERFPAPGSGPWPCPSYTAGVTCACSISHRRPKHPCPQSWGNCCALHGFCSGYLNMAPLFYCLCREDRDLGITTPRKYVPSWKK